MGVYKLANEVLFAFFESLIILFLYVQFAWDKEFIKRNIIKSVIFCILYSAFSYWASTYIPFGLHTIFIEVFAILILSYIIKTNIINSLIRVVLASLFIIVIDSSGSLIVMSLLKLNINEVVNRNGFL